MAVFGVDFTIFFRRLSSIPEHLSYLEESFYLPCPVELNGPLVRMAGALPPAPQRG